MTHTIQ